MSKFGKDHRVTWAVKMFFLMIRWNFLCISFLPIATCSIAWHHQADRGSLHPLDTSLPILIDVDKVPSEHRDVKTLLGTVAWVTLLFQACLYEYLHEAWKLHVGPVWGYTFVESYAWVTSVMQSFHCNSGVRVTCCTLPFTVVHSA